MAYGDKRDYPKIDILSHDGKYLCSTTWARTIREAEQRYVAAHPEHIPVRAVRAGK